MKLPGRILFVGAHCDDIELIAGGLLARTARQRCAIGVLVFSDHHGVLGAEQAAQARAEFADNLGWLHTVLGAQITDHSERMLAACRGEFEAERGWIYDRLERLRDDYDLVVTHASTDTNQDHRQVATEVARVFKAHASVWGGEFPNNDLGEFRPQVYVALDAAALDAKLRLVSHYRSQQINGRPYLDAEVVAALARHRGAQIRHSAAEAYSILARVVVALAE